MGLAKQNLKLPNHIPMAPSGLIFLLTGVVIANGMLGWAVARYGVPPTITLVAIGGLLVALVVALWDWRVPLYGLFLFLPFVGIPVILMYPNTGPANLIKDFAFVLPAYLGFLAARLSKGQPMTFRGAPVGLLLTLSFLLFIQTLNPASPSPFVALIGLKVWLFYVPLLFLGYYFIDSKVRLRKLLRFLCLVGLAPAIIGIIQAILIYGGRGDLVYGFYGPAAQAVTQQFVVFEYGEAGRLARISSTFQFVTQYTLFTSAMVAIGYAWLRSSFHPRLGTLVWVIFMAAALLSGSRGSFFLIFLLIGLMGLLDRQRGYLLTGVAVFLIGLLGAGVVTGMSIVDFFVAGWELLGLYGSNTFLEGVATAVSTSPLGLGTGVDTRAALWYASTLDPAFVSGPLPVWYESWFAKVAFELGIAGFALVVLLFGYLIVTLLRRHRQLRDRELRACSAAFLGLTIWAMLYLTKAQVIDLDPLDIYFWFFTGILFRLPTIEGSQRNRARSDSTDVVAGAHHV